MTANWNVAFFKAIRTSRRGRSGENERGGQGEATLTTWTRRPRGHCTLLMKETATFDAITTDHISGGELRGEERNEERRERKLIVLEMRR